MIEFLLKSTGCLAILLVFYHLVLEREKMHQFNRFYLLGSVLFSFIAPLFTITTQIPIEVVEVPTEYIEPIVFNQQIITETPINYWNIIIGISIAISLILSIRFVLNLYKIYKKVATNSTIQLENAVLILVDDAISPHTFWNYIFINKEEYHSNKIETELFTHELTHVTQKHTFDVLLIEVLKIVFWFNPLFYFLKKLMQLNHEFIADEKVINSCKNISEYQYLLLNRAAWNNDYYLASNLNYSLTKKRLVMMTTKTSKVNNWLKKLAVLPLLTGSIYVFAERVETYENVNNNEFIDAVIDKKEISDRQSSNTSEVLTDINKKLKDINSLKMSFVNKKNTFNVNLPNGEKVKVWEDRISDYIELNKTYETLRNQKPHYIKSSSERKKLLNNMYSKLGSLYFNLSKVDKRKVKRPIHPFNPYIRLKKGGKIYYKLKSDLTEEDKKLLPSPPKKGKVLYKNDSIPALKRIVNRKNETFTYTTKDGKTITKKFSELTDEEKKLMPPPPAPVVLKEKKLSTKLFKELKNSKKYAIWIDGKIVDNKVLNSYKNTDFYNYSGSFVHKNARSKRFPQEYQYQLNTKKHILKIKKQLPPPPPPAKDFNKKTKTGFINAKNQTLYYVKNEKGTTYYNRWGQEVTKEGEIINPEQTASNKIIPGQNITKVYKDDKIVSEFKRSNLPPPPPKATFPEVKKGDVNNITPPSKKYSNNSIPPPPPMSAEEMVFRYPKAKYYVNNKSVSHKKALTFVKNHKEISVLTQEKNGEKIIKFTQLKK